MEIRHWLRIPLFENCERPLERHAISSVFRLYTWMECGHISMAALFFWCSRIFCQIDEQEYHDKFQDESG